MDDVRLIVQLFTVFSGCLVALMSIMLFLKLRWPAPALWFLKLYISALSPVVLLISLLSVIMGLIIGSVFICLVSIYNVLIFSIHIVRVTRPPDPPNGFEYAFGFHWEGQLNPLQRKYFLRTRTIFKLPAVPNPRLEQNIPFSTIPGTGRVLLCDVWQPPENVIASGLVFIYLHGGAWYLLDKDLGTRPFFSQLAAQGHVIMDVAYRLAPETNMMGMVSDVKRSIVWMKENAGTYGVNPNKIVLGGGSSGAHLALMAAYTSNNPGFTPKELEGKDLKVHGVVSLYGPTNLEDMYFHTNQDLTTRLMPGRPQKLVPAQMPKWIIKALGKNYYRLNMDKGFVNAGSFAPLLGGHPDECPETYNLFSPATHVNADCPSTLLIHGEHDIMVPVKSIRILHSLLLEAKVKTIMHILPQTDHAFDLQLPKISPSAHNAIYDVERFLALLLILPKTK